MLSGFYKYNQEMVDFKKSKHYPETYNALVNYLWKRINLQQVHSAELESSFNLKSSEVREIVRYARRRGHPIESGGKGYHMNPDYDSYVKSLEHLEERARSQFFTVSMAKKNATTKCRQQMELPGLIRSGA